VLEWINGQQTVIITILIDCWLENYISFVKNGRAESRFCCNRWKSGCPPPVVPNRQRRLRDGNRFLFVKSDLVVMTMIRTRLER